MIVDAFNDIPNRVMDSGNFKTTYSLLPGQLYFHYLGK